ncbi:MAG: YHS domain-containing protein [Candidatus Zixiibacteriota bacterium]
MRRRDKIVIKKPEVITMTKDPICGMEVSESQAAASLEYKGQKFYFCASSCYDAFEKNPDKYSSGKKERWWTRFLNRLAQANRETYGGKAPKCH